MPYLCQPIDTVRRVLYYMFNTGEAVDDAHARFSF
jgi:hypothetical protein